VQVIESTYIVYKSEEMTFTEDCCRLRISVVSIVNTLTVFCQVPVQEEIRGIGHIHGCRLKWDKAELQPSALQGVNQWRYSILIGN
jgi:hypothetical protein